MCMTIAMFVWACALGGDLPAADATRVCPSVVGGAQKIAPSSAPPVAADANALAPSMTPDSNDVLPAAVGDTTHALSGAANNANKAIVPTLVAPTILVAPPSHAPWADPNAEPMDPNMAVHPARLPSRPHAEAVQLAARLVERGQYEAALAALKGIEAPSAQLIKARAWRGLGKWEPAEAALGRVRTVPLLAPLWQLEDGLLGAARGRRRAYRGQAIAPGARRR